MNTQIENVLAKKATPMVQLSRVMTLLTQINDRFLKGTKSVELDALWKDINHYEKCTVIVENTKNADRNGKPCGKACIKGQTTCMCHAPRPVKEKKVEIQRPRCATKTTKGDCKRFCVDGLTTCALHQPKEVVLCCFVLKAGKNANAACGHPVKAGETLCKRHTEKKETPEKVIVPVQEKVVAPLEKKEKVKRVRKVKEVADSSPSVTVPTIDIPTMIVVDSPHAPKAANRNLMAEFNVTISPILEAVPKVVVPAAIEPLVLEPAVTAAEEGACSWIMKAGAKKGTACGKKTAPGKECCVLHM